MTETKFTPGPWEVSPVLPGYYEWVRNSDGHLVADCASILPSEECVANASLIAAAPDMYKALEVALHTLNELPAQTIIGCVAPQVFEQLMDALAKARGEQ